MLTEGSTQLRRQVFYDGASRCAIHCARLLAFVTGLGNQELLLQNEYLVGCGRSPATRRLEDEGYLKGCRYVLHDSLNQRVAAQ